MIHLWVTQSSSNAELIQKNIPDLPGVGRTSNAPPANSQVNEACFEVA